MALEPELITFTTGDTAAIVDRMATLAERRDGWINLHPWVDDDDELPTVAAGLIAWLRARGPTVPEATFVPGEVRRRRTDPHSIGIQHPSGPKARQSLAGKGIEIPEGWRVRSDHPRRGLVVELPDDVDVGDVLAWLLRASNALSGTPLGDRWVAAVYRR